PFTLYPEAFAKQYCKSDRPPVLDHPAIPNIRPIERTPYASTFGSNIHTLYETGLRPSEKTPCTHHP
ncbi:MAG TPA: hypothetical protein VI603_14240, partial [Saprospiraceae bacterium]|nr:hypothetical protein [Saprospiraceae bacterium]